MARSFGRPSRTASAPELHFSVMRAWGQSRAGTVLGHIRADLNKIRLVNLTSYSLNYLNHSDRHIVHDRIMGGVMAAHHSQQQELPCPKIGRFVDPYNTVQHEKNKNFRQVTAEKCLWQSHSLSQEHDDQTKWQGYVC